MLEHEIELVINRLAGNLSQQGLDIEVGETAITSTTNIPGSGLMTIADPSSIITEVNVDEADVADIRLDQAAEIVAIAYPNQPLQGRVEFIANTAKIAIHVPAKKCQ